MTSYFFISSSWPLWVDYMTVVSHWLLILNSSCNIAIYLHKDPKFKAVLKEMILSKLSPSMRSKFELSFGGQDDLELNETVGGIARKKVSFLGYICINTTCIAIFYDFNTIPGPRWGVGG